MDGAIYRGENGVISLHHAWSQGEVPCLTSWTLEASASLNERNTRCMKSNGDDAANEWADQILEGKSFTLDLEFYWQENQTIWASERLDMSHVGAMISFYLYPDVTIEDATAYGGDAIIQSVQTTSEVNGDVTCSVSLVGVGAITKTD